jgi:hypothetical protein
LLAVVLVFAAVVLAKSRLEQHAGAPAAASQATAIPTSAEIEQQWGIRFTMVRLLAATGVVDVRYLVLDDSKAQRLHSEADRSALPTLRHGDGTIRPDSVMFHFHTESDTAGRTFDIIYGNAGGLLQSGSRVTIVTSDGLELRDVPVVE